MMKKIRIFLLDLISFGTPQAIVFNISAIFLLLGITPTSALVFSPFKCVFKHIIFPIIFGGKCPTEGLFAGCHCPGCGLTRAMSSLLHGDLAGAWGFNKLVFVVFAAMVVVLIINLIKSIRYYKKTGRIYPFEN